MKVLTFGEILLRLSTEGYYRLFQKDNLETSFCGSEANVAVSLALFGIDSAFLTKVPDNEVGKASINSLKYFGVDTKNVILDKSGRMGLYYLEKGFSQRSSRVIYDRKYSSFSLSKKEDFNWDEIFKDINWFHWSGITPALSSNMIYIIEQACVEAKKRNIVISCDLNYRKKLWNTTEAQNAMTKLIKFVDVCIANEEDVEKTLGIRNVNSDVKNAKLYINDYKDIANTIYNKFRCEYVAITLRESYSANNNGWSGILCDNKNGNTYVSRKYNINIVDRVGSGDSFAAGIIYGLINDLSYQDVVEFAVASSCLKHSIEGDYNRISVEEVKKLIKNGGNGRVDR